MKKFLLIAVLAVALIGLLAAPALAKTKTANFRPALMTAYVFTYNGGSWFEGTGDPSAPDLVGHWAATDADGNWIPGTADPIPANYDVVMQESWKLIPNASAAMISRALLIKLGIPEAGVRLSAQRSKAFWTGPELWDDYWVTQLWPIVPYDPRIKAKTYANRFLVPLTGKNGIATNLTADKKLPQGTYTVNYADTLLFPIIDLELMEEGQTEPYVFQPWPWTANPPFTFTVGAPVP
jgi:hypothetical protein